MRTIHNNRIQNNVLGLTQELLMLYIICSKAYFLANEDQAVAFVTVYDLAEFEDERSHVVASVAEVQLYASFSERQGKFCMCILGH